MDPVKYLEQPFGHLADLINAHAVNQPERIALDDGEERLTWGETAAQVNRIAAQLQADGLAKGQAVAILGTTTIRYALAYLGAIVAGGCAAPLTTSATPKQLANMMADSGAMHLFVDTAKRAELFESGVALPTLKHIMMDAAGDDAPLMFDWMADSGATPADPKVGPKDPFNIIYSSGTTGTPKGIVHSRQMRWYQMAVGENSGYGKPGQVSLFSTPLYSNTTLGIFVATIAYGGTSILMRKFDCQRWLELAQENRATHTMLVPVQYQRLMDFEGFDDYDLSTFTHKYCTSAPFSAELKAEVIKRMPGGLIEVYSMTEGGVVCILLAHAHPDKLHTVGIAWGGSEVITVDEELNRLPHGEMGELVGRSQTMMSGYQNQPKKTEEASWYDENGDRWQRMGDIGRVDEDGFITLMGRSKDMIISGGFNIYPRDLEEALMAQPGVADAAVIGVASRQWGEMPLGFVVAEQGVTLDMEALKAAANADLGKTQRLSELRLIDELPRSHIGKILKTELRDMV
ncbi:acyl--CoA ligase [Parasphingorhabdus halotolerans]|uniref:Acyl--CoA ligase n=1 Tax=Parasphingorhabdus halotolerans TaxID=2725558 RepID=A0A6H2DS04_9SPHN|nr:class I adenylate-forming enzyme family protein [Parasphingorhabdus halotolerans]QJB70763.1 acyl--CoA ligase [Parasphingorhabdus halotolerans]